MPQKYTVFNYTDGIFASPDTFTKKKGLEYIENFRLRYKNQGYYRDNKWNKIPPSEIELDLIPVK